MLMISNARNLDPTNQCDFTVTSLFRTRYWVNEPVRTIVLLSYHLSHFGLDPRLHHLVWPLLFNLHEEIYLYHGLIIAKIGMSQMRNCCTKNLISCSWESNHRSLDCRSTVLTTAPQWPWCLFCAFIGLMNFPVTMYSLCIAV